jgi:hypothetical protein
MFMLVLSASLTRMHRYVHTCQKVDQDREHSPDLLIYMRTGGDTLQIFQHG